MDPVILTTFVNKENLFSKMKEKNAIKSIKNSEPIKGFIKLALYLDYNLLKLKLICVA